MRILLTGLVASAIMIGSFLLWGGEFELLFTEEGVPKTLGPNGWLLVVGLLILDVFLPIPATAALATLGMTYGPWIGGLYGCLGTFLAGALGYGMCRLANERIARFLVGEVGLAMGKRLFRNSGAWAIALSRWTILLPELLSCFAGLVRMPAKTYFAALACGVAPMSFAYAWLGSTKTAQDNPLLALGLSAAVPVLLWAIVSRCFKPKDSF
ncbi:MAG: hypothetical protein CMI30_04680 [Opitutae bacterium]|nr:hypothetical protein [Opitutae bacterium]|tara:strand:+ start:486 stop:1118 length:633 start_codon:yes stop_codon:yes gene_type:complete